MSNGIRVPLLILLVVAAGALCAGPVLAQPTAYYLHDENGANFATAALKPTPADTATVVSQTADFKGRKSPLLNQFMGLWTTVLGDPQRAGTIPAGSTVTFTLWMRKTSTHGVVVPFASLVTVETLDVNFQAKQGLCGANGPTALDTTLRAYTFSCSLPAAVTIASTERLALFAGYSMTQPPGNKSMRIELHYEGATDSHVVVPLPAISPSVTSVSPTTGAVGQAVTIAGTGFGATQGASTITFNGTPAVASAWNATSISTAVPAGATSGPLVVTVNGAPSNAVDFAVLPAPALTSIEPSQAYAGEAVTLTGSHFAPGDPVVTFNGAAASLSSATPDTITATVPALATSGPVVVSVNGLTSNALPFTVLTPAAPAILTVQTYYFDEAAAQQGPPAGAGVYVRVDGVPVGQTLPDGTLTVQLEPGDRLVTAIEPSSAIGEASITLSPGEVRTVTIVLDDGKDVVEPTALIVVESVDGIVPIGSPTFTMQFFNGTAAAPVTAIREVDLRDRQGNLEFTLTSMFTVSEGAIVATAPQNMFLWLPWTEPAELHVQAVDADGFTHAGVVRFSMGQFALNLTLSAPPSNPALTLSGLEVDVAVVGTSIVLRRTSDAQGQISIPWLPHSTLILSSSATAGDVYYYAWSTLSLSGDTVATFVLRNVIDVINNVPPIATSSPVQAFSTATAESPIRSARDAEMQDMLERRRATDPFAPPPFSVATAEPTFDPVAITVTSDGTDEPVYQNATLTVPQGTETVTLKYSVLSLEYPEWVRQQSPFDDVWNLSVYGGPGGQQLFQIARNVNSQQTGAPAWQGDSSTGDIQQELDVSSLAANGDVQLVLVASAVNIRDFHFNTTVNAELGAPPKLTIDTITKDTVIGTKSKSEFVSIPRSNPAKNTHERWLTLNVTKPAEATITKVRVTLRSGAGATLQELFEEAPGQNVKLENNGRTIKVRVTMHTLDSAVPSTPPPTHIIRYRFVVHALLDGQPMSSDPKDSEELLALWRMPAGFARYGGQPPDPGLDDWASRGGYDWLSRNAGLLAHTSINDVSGEHARNLGHTQHARGEEMDIFHFHKFAGAYNASSNYRLLRDKVIAGLNGNSAAATDVKTWVTKMRSGLDALLALPDVEKLYSTKGKKHTASGIELPTGWAEQLIKHGTLTVGSKTLDLDIGEWTNASHTKMTYNEAHDNHGHITLDGSKLLK